MSRAVSFFRNWRLRKKLVATYTILIIIPIVALGLYSYRTAEKYLQEQARIGLSNTVEQMALHIDEKLSQPRNFMEFMVYNPTVKKVMGYEWGDDMLRYTKELNDNIEPTIWYYININQEIKDIAFYSEYTGTQLGNFVYPSEGVRDEPWYQEAKASNKTLWYAGGGKLFAVRQIWNYDNTAVVGVVHLTFNYDKLFQTLQPARGSGERILIADDRGQSIYSALGEEGIGETDLNRIRSTRDKQVAMNGESYLLSKASLRNSAWTLYVLTPVRGFVMDMSSIIKATVTIVLACLLILVLFIWLFSRTLVRPIYALKRKINIVEDGDFDVVIASSSKDEIGELTDSFARMVQRVKRLIRELDHARGLEKEAELKALQAQITPHFLYNSLSTINWKAIQIDSPEISKIANSLSRFYRTSLNKGRRITSVAEEVANIRAYLDIQLIMHNNEFDVELNIEERAMPFATLNFILQPIVENAIIHGIDEKESGRGVLRISVALEEGVVRFTVQDNGKGMSEKEIRRLYEEESGGYGLRNVHERIRLHYGPAYGVRVESVPGARTKVDIVIPTEHPSV